MRKSIFLALAILMVSPMGWTLTTGTQTTLKPYTAPPTIAERWITKIETKRVRSYQLDDIYNLQINYPEEKIIDLIANSYIIQFTSEGVEQYLNIEQGLPKDYLRQVSGKVLGLLLYRLGGDGTDHYQDCQSLLIKRLPEKQFAAFSNQWTATYSGVIVDFEGTCSQFHGSSAYYVYMNISYDPIAQTGEIFVGGEDLTGVFAPSMDLFNLDNQ